MRHALARNGVTVDMLTDSRAEHTPAYNLASLCSSVSISAGCMRRRVSDTALRRAFLPPPPLPPAAVTCVTDLSGRRVLVSSRESHPCSLRGRQFRIDARVASAPRARSRSCSVNRACLRLCSVLQHPPWRFRSWRGIGGRAAGVRRPRQWGLRHHAGARPEGF